MKSAIVILALWAALGVLSLAIVEGIWLANVRLVQVYP